MIGRLDKLRAEPSIPRGTGELLPIGHHVERAVDARQAGRFVGGAVGVELRNTAPCRQVIDAGPS